jgi:hypothetical protein
MIPLPGASSASSSSCPAALGWFRFTVHGLRDHGAVFRVENLRTLCWLTKCTTQHMVLLV